MNKNKELMRQIFSELSNGNGKPFTDAMADTFRWTIIGTTDWSGTYRGKQAVIEDLLKPLMARFATRYTNNAHRFIADGEYVVVQCRGNVTTTSGLQYSNQYCWVCRLAGGKLQELTEYCDTELMEAALGPRVREAQAA